MSSRTTRKKSRRGCIKCRERRVKCDEKRPCGNCVRREDYCSLDLSLFTPFLRPKLPATGNGDATTHSENRDPKAEAQGTGTLPSSSITEPPPLSRRAAVRRSLERVKEAIDFLDRDVQSELQPPQPSEEAQYSGTADIWAVSPSDWLQDLRLLHHFCSTACETLACDESRVHIWRDIVPPMACSYDFLMHGVLAISALHLAHTSAVPAASSRVLAMRHQTAALEHFRSHLGEINETNCHAYFILGSVISMMITFSIADSNGGTESGTIAQIISHFKLLQGIQDMVSLPSALDWLRAGALKAFFTSRGTQPLNIPADFLSQIPHLESFTRTIAGTTGPRTILSPCLAALDSLQHAYRVISQPDTGAGSMWIWPMSLTPEFLDILEHENAVALVILAHFAALIRPFEHGLWFLDGWSGAVVDAVGCALDDESEGHWVSWPRRHVRGELENY